MHPKGSRHGARTGASKPNSASPPELPLKLGVVLFDGPEPGPGVWCDADGNMGSFEHPLALASDHVWVTNIAWDKWYAEGSPWRNVHPGLRHDSFLRIKPQQLLREITSDGQVEFLPIVGFFLNRIVARLALNVRQRNPLSVLMPEPEEKDGDPPIPDAVLADLRGIPWVRVNGPFVRGLEYRSYRVPRHLYYRFLLDLPLPVGKWSRTLGAPAPGALSDETGNIARATVRDREVDAAPGADRLPDADETGRLRLYLTWAEVEQVSTHAVVEIDHYYTGPLARRPVLEQLRPEKVSTLSYSDSLSLEVAYRARLSHPVYGPWVAAYDRVAMRRHARALADAGAMVAGYGSGKVLVRMARDTRVEIDDMALSLGLEPPSGGGDEPALWQAMPPISTAKGLSPEYLMALDLCAHLPVEKRKVALEEAFSRVMREREQENAGS